MRRYGIRSAILTTMGFWRANLKTKEAVKQLHCVARKDQLEKENRANVIVERIISEDLELFYTNLQNPERQIKEECARFFSTPKLTEEELMLLENRDIDFLDSFSLYESDSISNTFDWDMMKIEKSGDLDSIFSRNDGFRQTIHLNATLKSMQEEMRKRVANEDQSDMELKKKTC